MLTQMATIRSGVDATVKHVLRAGNEVIEFSCVRKDDGKDIIVVPIQTSCNLGCKFCYLTGSGLPVRNLTALEVVEGVERVVSELKLPTSPALLVSFMGSGEPLMNLEVVIEACILLRTKYSGVYEKVRFAVASIIPKLEQMWNLIKDVKRVELPIKFHWSLHSAKALSRGDLIPAAAAIHPSMESVVRYVETTGNPAEIHYTLIDGVNDDEAHLNALACLLEGKNVPIKFLAFKEGVEAGLTPSKRMDVFRATLEKLGVVTEYYDPPGSDIGSSCGQFTMVNYA